MAQYPNPLSAKYTGTWAYTTVKDRMPVIVAKTVDILTRNRDAILARFKTSSEEVQQQAFQEFKHAISGLSALRYEMMTDKPLTPFEDDGDVETDTAQWNKSIAAATAVITDGDLSTTTSKPTTGVPYWDEAILEWPPQWYDAPWLLVECYMYRRMHSTFARSTLLRGLDPFFVQKEESFRHSLPAILCLLDHIQKSAKWMHSHFATAAAGDEQYKSSTIRDEFSLMMQLCLWGNKCDMSSTNGTVTYQTANLFEQLDEYRSRILCNDMTRIWQLLISMNEACRKQQNNTTTTRNRCVRVDLVIDNAGFELFVDLCLADFLIAAGLADVVYFHCKRLPWFVSDANKKDFYWTLEQMVHLARQKLACEKNSSSPSAATSDEVNNSAEEISDLRASINDSNAAEDNAGAASLAQQDKIHVHNPVAFGWLERLRQGQWILCEHAFWTLPYDYDQMQAVAPDLYTLLSESNLLIFKGDLHYRKLVGDLKWPINTSLAVALRSFKPTNLVALRTLKADVCVGLDVSVKERLSKVPNWMVSGEYAVVQLFKSQKQKQYGTAGESATGFDDEDDNGA